MEIRVDHSVAGRECWLVRCRHCAKTVAAQLAGDDARAVVAATMQHRCESPGAGRSVTTFPARCGAA